MATYTNIDKVHKRLLKDGEHYPTILGYNPDVEFTYTITPPYYLIITEKPNDKVWLETKIEYDLPYTNQNRRVIKVHKQVPIKLEDV